MKPGDLIAVRPMTRVSLYSDTDRYLASKIGTVSWNSVGIVVHVCQRRQVPHDQVVLCCFHGRIGWAMVGWFNVVTDEPTTLFE